MTTVNRMLVITCFILCCFDNQSINIISIIFLKYLLYFIASHQFLCNNNKKSLTSASILSS